jgi:hypothetical protein
MKTLDRIMEITESVEQFVERGAWAEAGILDEERRRLLQELLNGESDESLDEYREFLPALLKRNEATVQRLSQRRREMLAAAAGEINAGRSVARAYGDNDPSKAPVRLRALPGGTGS